MLFILGLCYACRSVVTSGQGCYVRSVMPGLVCLVSCSLVASAVMPFRLMLKLQACYARSGMPCRVCLVSCSLLARAVMQGLLCHVWYV